MLLEDYAAGHRRVVHDVELEWRDDIAVGSRKVDGRRRRSEPLVWRSIIQNSSGTAVGRIEVIVDESIVVAAAWYAFIQGSRIVQIVDPAQRHNHVTLILCSVSHRRAVVGRQIAA